MRPLSELVLLALIALTGSVSLAAGADVSLMVGGIEKQIYLPAVLAQQLGYFRDEGLTVTLVDAPAVPSPGAVPMPFALPDAGVRVPSVPVVAR